MRFLILFGLITTISVVFCKDHYSYQRDSTLPRKYKDNKNKRGINDYPGLTYGAQSFQGFPTYPAGGLPFAQGIPSFGGFGGFNFLNQNSFNPLSSSSHGFPNTRTHSLANHNLGHSLNVGQNSAYDLQSSTLNFERLLGTPINSQSSYLSANSGLYSQLEKTGPVTFTSQGSVSPQSQPQYTPVYATGAKGGSGNYVIPVILGASQGSNQQPYKLPSSTFTLSSPSFSINSPSTGNGASYGNSYIPVNEDSSSHVVSSGYIMSSSIPQQNTSPASYSIPIPGVASAPSSSEYTMSLSASPYTSISNNPIYSNSSPSLSYQIPIAKSLYTSNPSSASSGDYSKYSTSYNDNTYSNSNQLRSYGMTLKLENLANPSTFYRRPLNSNSGYSNSVDTNYVVTPSYSNNNVKVIPARQSNYLVTSYGTPVMSYAIPSTNYGTPTNSQSIGNSNYNAQSSIAVSPSLTYTTSDVSRNSNFGNMYSSPSISSSYESDSSHKNSERTSTPVSYSRPSTNYSPSSNILSSDENSILNYKNTSSSLSNIENYSSSPSSNMYDSGADSSSSYSNLSSRYLNRLLPYMGSNSEVQGSSSYDTISYSIPNGKY